MQKKSSARKKKINRITDGYVLNFRIPDKIADRLKSRSEELGMPLAGYLRLVLTDHVGGWKHDSASLR